MKLGPKLCHDEITDEAKQLEKGALYLLTVDDQPRIVGSYQGWSGSWDILLFHTLHGVVGWSDADMNKRRQRELGVSSTNIIYIQKIER